MQLLSVIYSIDVELWFILKEFTRYVETETTGSSIVELTDVNEFKIDNFVKM